MFVPNDVTYTEIVTHVEKHMYIYTGSGTTKQIMMRVDLTGV
jgi:Uri superfamily endonuclease